MPHLRFQLKGMEHILGDNQYFTVQGYIVSFYLSKYYFDKSQNTKVYNLPDLLNDVSGTIELGSKIKLFCSQ